MTQMSATLVINEQQFVYFDTTNPITIESLISSLQAVQGLTKNAPSIIKNLTGVNIQKIEVFIEKIETGSIKERLIFKLFFDSEEDYHEWLKKNPKMRKALIALVMAGSILGTISFISNIITPKTNGTTININNNSAPVFVNSPIIAATSDLLDKSKDEVEKAFIAPIKKSRSSYIKNTIKFIDPVRDDDEAEISWFDKDDPQISQIDSIEAAYIPNHVILSIPEKYEDIQETDTKSFEKLAIKLHAMDRDKFNSGWEGSIEDIVPNRTKIIFSDEIETSKLFGKTLLVVDADIEYRYDRKSKKMKPHLIYVSRLR